MTRANLKITFITCLDTNNLYRWAMSTPLTKSGFKWKHVMPTEKQLIKMKEHPKKGWILELDLEHDAQNSYPLTPEKKVIKIEQMSSYENVSWQI